MGYFDRKRANSVVIPDEPLNNIKVCSGVAELILHGQFNEDISYYRQLFNVFLVTHYKKDLLSFDKNVLREIDEHAVFTNDGKNLPNSTGTLIYAEESTGELGAAIKNAMIFSIAMCMATESKTRNMKNVIAAASLSRSASKTKSNDEYRAAMSSMHPRAAAIAETLGHLESKRVAHDVVTIMGYLIDKADISIDETVEQKAARISDEQRVSS